MSSIKKHKSGQSKTNTLDSRQRRLVLSVGALLGASAAAPFLAKQSVSTALAYTPRKNEALIAAGKLFSSAQMSTLRAVCQTVIPATDTLGAGDVDVHGFIDNQLLHCFKESDQQKVIQLIASIDEHSGERFDELEIEEQHKLLNRIDTPGLWFDQTTHQHFRFLKSLIVFGYFTTEEGASKALKFLAFPGDFKGSVPYDEVGRAFGSHAYY